MKRRKFLMMGAASLTSALSSGFLSGCSDSSSPNASEDVDSTANSGSDLITVATTNSQTFFITEGFIQQPDEKMVYFRGFSQNDSIIDVPAQPFTIRQGEEITVVINNTLSSDHSFVIDGIIDSGIIKGGESKTLVFVADKAGSYIFYDNLNAPYNRLSGLHGGLAVMPIGSDNELYIGSPTFKQQYIWVINDIDPVWHNKFINNDLPTTPFTPAYFTINGLSMRVPGHPEYKDPLIDAGYNTQTRIVGSIGDRALIRTLHAGMCTHSMHWHANHVEWLTRNGVILENIWEKDTILLPRDKGKIDVIYPFTPPPNAFPSVSTGHYPMHFHDEMTQTAGGGLYQFGLATTIEFK